MAFTASVDQDVAMVELVRQEPGEGFSLLLKRYGHLIQYVVGRFVHQRMDREDLYQEVILHLLEDGCRRVTQWEPRVRFSTYLFLVVWRICARYRYRMNRHKRLLSNFELLWEDDPVFVGESAEIAPTQRSLVALAELLHQIHACFDIMIASGAAQKKDLLLVLLRAEHHSARLVGEVLDLDENVVHRRFNRLCQRLRDCLAEHGFQSFSDLLTDFAYQEHITE